MSMLRELYEGKAVFMDMMVRKMCARGQRSLDTMLVLNTYRKKT